MFAAENAAQAAATHAQRACGGAAAAGLVSSKTTRQSLFVEFHPSAVADRRVRRLKRSVWASGHCHGIADHGRRPPVCWFVTLTYVGVRDWKSDHVAKAIRTYRSWCKSHKVACRYTWVAELQGRGAVHYHLLAWLPRGLRMPKWDKPTPKRGGYREPFWPHGMTNTQKAKAGVGYLMKYLSKLGELTRFPKGLRLYGIGGLEPEGRAVRSWLNLPEWVKASYGVGDVRRVSRGFVVCDTGELLEPAYRVSLVPGGIEVHALRELPARFHDGAYSSYRPMGETLH